MAIPSRTSTGRPSRCLVCETVLKVEPSDPAGEFSCPGCGSVLRFAEEAERNVAILRLGESMVTSENLQGLISWVKTRADEALVIDFQNATFMTSAALAQLISLKKTLKRNLSFRNLQPDLREVFRVTRLGEFFDLGDL